MHRTLKGMAGAAARYRKSLLLLALYLAVAAGLYLAFAKKSYESTAEILFRPAPSAPAGLSALEAGPRRDREIQNEIRILTSADTLLDAARAITGSVDSANSTDSAAPEASTLALRAYLQKNLTVSPAPNADVVTARFRFPEPERARAVLALIIERFQSRRAAVRSGSGDAAAMRKALPAARATYAAALEELTRFETASRLYDGSRVPALAEALLARRAQLASLKNEHVYATAKLARLQESRAGLPENTLTLVRESHNPIRDDFRGRLTDLSLKKERLLARYQEDYSSVAEVQKEIDNLTELIDSEPERVVNEKETRPNDSWLAVNAAVLSLEPEVAAMAERIRHLETQIQAEETALARANRRMGELAALSRDAELKKEAYDRLQFDYAAATGLRGGGDGAGTASVLLSPTLNPAPVAPSAPRVLGLAAAALLLGGLFLIGLRAATDSALSTPEEAERVLARPIAGTFGNLSRAGLDGAVPAAAGEAAFERQRKNFRQLYLRVAGADGPTALLFTSSMAGPDALSLAYNFAAFAREYQGRSVAVVNYAAGGRRAPAERDGPPAPVPAGPDRSFRGVYEFIRPENTEVVAGKRFLEELKSRYDLVVVNYEPLQESPILIALSDEIDRVVYRVGLERTNRFQASYELEALKVFGFADVSLALTERRGAAPTGPARTL